YHKKNKEIKINVSYEDRPYKPYKQPRNSFFTNLVITEELIINNQVPSITEAEIALLGKVMGRVTRFSLKKYIGRDKINFGDLNETHLNQFKLSYPDLLKLLYKVYKFENPDEITRYIQTMKKTLDNPSEGFKECSEALKNFRNKLNNVDEMNSQTPEIVKNSLNGLKTILKKLYSGLSEEEKDEINTEIKILDNYISTLIDENKKTKILLDQQLNTINVDTKCKIYEKDMKQMVDAKLSFFENEFSNNNKTCNDFIITNPLYSEGAYNRGKSKKKESLDNPAQ